MTYYFPTSARNIGKKRRQREELMRRLWALAGQALLTIAMSILLSWLLINWMMGCGEVFHAANGALIQGECISLTFGAF